MRFWALSVDFKTAPLEKRVQFANLHDVKNCCRATSEFVVLSTCNRAEIYGVGEEPPAAILTRWLEDVRAAPEDRSLFQCVENEYALRHLFRVVSSIESMVVGETQIFGQVKRAYEKSVELGSVGPVLHRVFQAAFKIGKRIRQSTEVGRMAVSLPSVGVKLAERILGDLTARTVGIIGLGEIGRVSAEHFASIQPKRLLLLNRTRRVADDMAMAIGKPSEVAESLERLLEVCDVIVSAASEAVISEAQMSRLDERDRTTFVLDLSTPRSVGVPTSLSRVFAFSVDDLQKISEENSNLRRHEILKAEAILEEEVRRLFQTLMPSDLKEIFSRVAAKATTLTHEELAALQPRLKGMNSSQWSEIEKMAERLTSKLLKDPMEELRLQMEKSESSESFLEFFRNIFRV